MRVNTNDFVVHSSLQTIVSFLKGYSTGWLPGNLTSAGFLVDWRDQLSPSVA